MSSFCYIPCSWAARSCGLLHRDKTRHGQCTDDASVQSYEYQQFKHYCKILDKAKIWYHIINEFAFLRFNIFVMGRQGDTLLLVVYDIAGAAERLTAAGYVKKDLYDGLSPKQRTLIPDCYGPPFPHYDQSDSSSYDTAHLLDECAPLVNLLDATQWDFGPERIIAKFPSLPQLMNCYLSKLVDIRNSEYLQAHVESMLVSCYADRENYPVNTSAFASHIAKENRQLHFDLVSGTIFAIIARESTLNHYRGIRDKIRQSQIDPIAPRQH